MQASCMTIVCRMTLPMTCLNNESNIGSLNIWQHPSTSPRIYHMIYKCCPDSHKSFYVVSLFFHFYSSFFPFPHASTSFFHHLTFHVLQFSRYRMRLMSILSIGLYIFVKWGFKWFICDWLWGRGLWLVETNSSNITFLQCEIRFNWETSSIDNFIDRIKIFLEWMYNMYDMSQAIKRKIFSCMKKGLFSLYKYSSFSKFKRYLYLLNCFMSKGNDYWMT